MADRAEFDMTAGYYSPVHDVYVCPLCVEGGVGYERVTPLVCDEAHVHCFDCGIDLCMAFDKDHLFWSRDEAMVERAKLIRARAEAEHESG